MRARTGFELLEMISLIDASTGDQSPMVRGDLAAAYMADRVADRIRPARGLIMPIKRSSALPIDRERGAISRARRFWHKRESQALPQFPGRPGF